MHRAPVKTSKLDRNYTLDEAAERIPSLSHPEAHVSRRTIERWVSAGIIRSSSIRGRTRYLAKADVEYLMDGGSPDELLEQHKMAG